ncbi:lipocalin family protein [Aquimarina sp. AU474]|uniref:lipocalin family protein n=1 Tax=Aquimarina sp. AU474 TaxID=2108529 RepID=UPI000D69CF55|nr:lipocalin family protein [Aquimarina sp. AU474]
MLKIKNILLYILCGTLLSCTSSNPEEYKKHITGYWEIERVLLSDGSEKEYTFNQSIDFFEVNDSVGIRKKVQPRLNGSFIVTKDSETFLLKVEDDSLRIHYKTPLDSWRETIISAKESQIIIKNESGNTYFYKRYKKIEL